MTATQAPTPGPLSASRVGTNSGHGHAWKRPDGVKMRCGGTRICSECAKDAALVADVVFAGKQTLAPTAPVEASGSEREEVDRLAKVYADATDYYVPFHRGLSSPSSDQIRKGIRAVIAALRPQPSGETREVPIWIRPMVAALEGYEADYGGPLDDMHELGRIDDSRSSPSFRIRVGHIRDLALLSARPIALGGQQGVGLAASEIGAHIAKRDAEYEAALADLTITPDASSLDEFGRSIFGALSDCPAMSIDKQADFVARALWPAVSALSTTPARVEAQDKGAATRGWDREICTGCSSSLSLSDIKEGGFVSCCPDRRMVKVSDLVDAYEASLRTAHSSPTPAAEPVAIVPAHCTGISLAFEPGVLHVSTDGSGYIAIDEKHFELEDDRCEGPDGPEGSLHWITRLDASEVVALRDFLNGATPVADADRVRIAVEALEFYAAGGLDGTGGGVAIAALAALKSTAAKEGGEG